MYNYNHYKKSDVKNLHPGYSPVIWVAPRSAFVTLAEPTGAGTTAGDTVRIATAHTFLEDEGFIRLTCAPDSVEANGTLVGPKGAKRMKYQAKFIIQGDSPALLETMKNLVNEDLIVIAKDANCPGDQYIQLGCECTPVNASEGAFNSSNTGADDGQKSWEITMEAYCKYFYDAVVTEKPEA